MKNFIKKIIVFFVLASAALVAITLIPNAISKNNADFKINKDADYVIFGHSHACYSYNDTIISNFQNLADSGESYFYTYQKVKNIIPNNPQIKTVFIEFANNQIDIKMDEWIWGYEKMSYFLPIYAPFIDRDDFNLLYERNSQDLTTCLSIAAKRNIIRTAKGNFNVINSIDGYKWTDINKINEMLEKAKSDTTDYDVNYKVSHTNIDYLRKIIDFCKLNDKEVFLVRSPQHSALPNLKNEIHYQNIKSNYFDDIPLLDFNSLKVPNTYYVDLDHLNYKGAELFSKMFNDLLSNNLLDKPDKQSQILEAISNYSLTK